MVSDNIAERLKEPIKAGNVDISVPVVVKSNMKKTYEQLQDETAGEQNPGKICPGGTERKQTTVQTV